jgi:hypothetical protein
MDSSRGAPPEPVAGDRLTYRLRNCPYRAVVRERQTLVSGVHRGVTHGLLDSIDAKTKLAGFEPKDPVRPGAWWCCGARWRRPARPPRD